MTGEGVLDGREFSQYEVVTLAVYLLGGAQHPVDTEDVALLAHELTPGRFSWRKYPEYINLERVRVSLSDAKKTEGGLLSGSGRNGWSLTQKGLAWSQEAARQRAGLATVRQREKAKKAFFDEDRRRRERARIFSTSAWERWIAGEKDVQWKEAAQVFRIDSYVTGNLLELKIMRLVSLFEEDEELCPFLAHIAATIQHLEESR